MNTEVIIVSSIEMYWIKYIGKKQDDIIDYTKAIDINPEKAITYYLRGIYYFQYYRGNALDDLLKKEDAIIDYSKFCEIEYKYDDYYLERGKIF